MLPVAGGPAPNLTALAASLALLGALAAPGVAALRRFAPELERLERLAYGIPLGLVGGTLGLFVLACGFGLTPAVIVTTALSGVLLTALLLRSGRRAPPPTAGPNLGAWSSPGGIAALLVLGAFTLRFAVLWWTVLQVDAQGLSAGFANLWADWAMHLGDVSSFAYGDNFPPLHPRLWGHPFSYHFLTSVTVAAMVRLGLDPIVAMPLHSFLLTIAILFGLYAFAAHFLESRLAALLAVTFFMLGGGWGWWLPVRSAWASPSGLASLLAQPWDQAAQEAANYRWQNLYFSLVGPQRSCLYGLPLGMLALRLLDTAARTRARRFFWLAGVAAGLLPMAHQGTFLTLALTTPFLLALFPSRGWILFFAVWAGLGLPQLIFLARGNPSALQTIRFHLGWIARPDPWVWFWLKNLGLLIPLAIVGLTWRRVLSPPARRFLLGLMPPFVIANLFLLLPWDWDNTKILTFWFIAICVLAAATIAAMWRTWNAAAIRLALIVAVVSLVLSGLLLNLHQIMGRDRHPWMTTEELDLARAIRTRTPPHALIATGMRPNHPITMLSGRRVIVGYGGWMWAQGLDCRKQEHDLRAILAFAPEAPALLSSYGVDYVVIGPEERDRLGAREDAYAARYPTLLRTPNYRVFAISRSGPAVAAVVTSNVKGKVSTRPLRWNWPHAR